jgi:hypothetical protein
MADAKAAAAAPAADAKGAAKADAPKKKGGFGFIILMILIGALVPFCLPSIILFVGMAPTLVALFTETDRRGSSVAAVGAMNAAGIVPFIIDLWSKGQTMGNAIFILQDPQTWLVMFGAAAVGQLILFAVPQAIASMTAARAETRIELLKENLELLKMTWGPDVATTKPMEKVMRGN